MELNIINKNDCNNKATINLINEGAKVTNKQILPTIDINKISKIEIDKMTNRHNKKNVNAKNK